MHTENEYSHTVPRGFLVREKVKVKVSYLTSVAKQAKTAFLHGPTVWKSPIVGLVLRKKKLSQKINKHFTFLPWECPQSFTSLNSSHFYFSVQNSYNTCWQLIDVEKRKFKGTTAKKERENLGRSWSEIFAASSSIRPE